MLRTLHPLCVALACASLALAQEPAPKRPDLPDLGRFDGNSADWVARRSCDGSMLTVVSRSPFSVTATTKGGEFESEIARHSCNQECRGATHETCAPGTCYSVHTHDEGLKLKWDQSKTDEIVKKISASIKAALPKGAELNAGVEQEIKKSVTSATSAEQTLRGCLADACTIRTEAGGFLLKVNPGQVVVTGYHTFTVVYQCTSVGHSFYPDSWYCSPGKALNSWYSTEITDIQFHGGVNMTFTKWLVPGPSCACKPGHRIVVPPPSVPPGTTTREKETPAPEPPREHGGCGCDKKRQPSIPPWKSLPPDDRPSWRDPQPPVEPGPWPGFDEGEGPRWLPPVDDHFVPPWPRDDRELPPSGETSPKRRPLEEEGHRPEERPPCDDR